MNYSILIVKAAGELLPSEMRQWHILPSNEITAPTLCHPAARPSIDAIQHYKKFGGVTCPDCISIADKLPGLQA